MNVPWSLSGPLMILSFMTGRYRVRFHSDTLQNLCVGSSVSSFTPASEK